MKQKAGTPETAQEHVRAIRRATRKKYSAEEKIRIVLDGLRGESSLPSCVDVKASRKGFTTAGRRSFWKRARSD